MIPDRDCELRWNLNDGRLWIGIAASSIVLGSSECRRGRFHLTILTATGVSHSPAPALLDRLERSLKKSISGTHFFVFGCGGARWHNGHWHGPPAQGHSHVACSDRFAHAIVQPQERLVLQHCACGSPDRRTSFHLSIDYFVLGVPVALPGPTF